MVSMMHVTKHPKHLLPGSSRGPIGRGYRLAASSTSHNALGLVLDGLRSVWPVLIYLDYQHDHVKEYKRTVAKIRNANQPKHANKCNP